MPLQEEMEQQGNFLFKYRGYLPVVILLVALVVYGAGVRNGIEFPPYYTFICFAVSLAGLFLRIYTIGHTPKNTSGRNTQGQLADEMNTTGIYATVRHPLYLGNFFMWLGAAMLTFNFWFIIFFIFWYWVYYERIMFAEEQYLRNKFGDAYVQWAQNTPAFIPSITKFSEPAYSFSLKKVLKKEVNGLLNIFIVFALFDLIKTYLQYDKIKIDNWFWTGGMIISFIVYVVLKIITKKTTLLHDPNRI